MRPLFSSEYQKFAVVPSVCANRFLYVDIARAQSVRFDDVLAWLSAAPIDQGF
jgi:hypothetical protein